jgi:hypothetical protein
MAFFGLIKDKGKQQPVYILTDDRMIERNALPLEKGYMETRGTREAWYQIPRWFVRLTNCRDGSEAREDRYIQLLSERNAIPIPLGLTFGVDREADVKALTDLKPIAREKYREEKQVIEENASRNKWLMNGLTIASLGVVSFILIMAVIFLFQTDKLKRPNF